MHIYVCMHACMHVYIYMHIYVCMHACMHVYIYMHVYVCMHACIYIYTCIYMYACMHACIRMCGQIRTQYVCTYIYGIVYTYKQSRAWCEGMCIVLISNQAYVYIYIYIFIYIYMHAYIHTYIRIYIHTYLNNGCVVEPTYISVSSVLHLIVPILPFLYVSDRLLYILYIIVSV